jgi:hypothetical protein
VELRDGFAAEQSLPAIRSKAHDVACSSVQVQPARNASDRGAERGRREEIGQTRE